MAHCIVHTAFERTLI